MGNPLGKSRRKRRKVSQASQSLKQPATTTVPVETIEKIIHLHDIEHKGSRKLAAELGITKDRAYRLYKKNASSIKKHKQKILSQNREYIALRKTEQEIEKKTRIAVAKEESRRRIKNLQMQRAETALGLGELFSNPEEMLEFAQHTVEECKRFLDFCVKHKLKPAKTLFEIIGSKQDYLSTGKEEGGVQILPEYIGSTLDSWLMDQEEKMESQRLKRLLNDFIANFKCAKCGVNEEAIAIAYNQLLCKNCGSFYDIPCPKCGNNILINITGDHVTEYHCPSCKLTIRPTD